MGLRADEILVYIEVHEFHPTRKDRSRCQNFPLKIANRKRAQVHFEMDRSRCPPTGSLPRSTSEKKRAQVHRDATKWSTIYD